LVFGSKQNQVFDYSQKHVSQGPQQEFSKTLELEKQFTVPTEETRPSSNINAFSNFSYRAEFHGNSNF
jgi:hypothetical protein